AYLLEHLAGLNDPLIRGSVWVTLWEETLDRRVRAGDFVRSALRALPREETEQNVQLVLGYVGDAFWTLLNESERRELAAQLEQTLKAGLDRAPSSSMKATYFSSFRSIATTSEGMAFIERVWRRQEKIPGLTLAEPDEAGMALDLAVRAVPASSAILEE